MFHRAFNIGGLEREKTCRKKLHLPRTAARRFSLYQEKNARKIQRSRAATRGGEGRTMVQSKSDRVHNTIQRAATSRDDVDCSRQRAIMLLPRRFFVVFTTPSRGERTRGRGSRDEVEHGCDERAILLPAKREDEIVESISRARSRPTRSIGLPRRSLRPLRGVIRRCLLTSSAEIAPDTRGRTVEAIVGGRGGLRERLASK